MLRRLRAAVTAAEGAHERIRQSVFQQRRTTQAAISADIMQRCGGPASIPPPMRGAAAPLTPLQVAANGERAKLSDAEVRLSTAAAALADAKGSLLAFEESILSARREALALKIIARKASEAERVELLALTPDDFVVPPDQRFHVGPIVAHAKTLIEGTLDSVNVPCNKLNSTESTDDDWSATRARILEQHAA